MTTEDSIERPYGWVVVIASLLVMTIGAGGYYVVIVGLTLVAEDYDGLRWVPSLAYSFSVLGMGLGGIFIGRWTDRIGVGTPATLGSLMVVSGAFVVATTSSRWTLLAAHGLLIGLLGNAALFSPLIANVARWFDRRRGLAVSVVASAQGLAGVVWPAVFRSLVESIGWRASYRSYALFALVTMVPLTFFLRPRAPVVPERGNDAAATGGGSALGLAPGWLLGSLCVAIVGCCVAMAMPIVHVVAHTTDLGYPLARAAEVLGVLLGCAFFSRIAWGALADRWGGLPVLMSASVCQALVLASYLFVDGLTALYVVSAAFGLAFGGIIPSYMLVVGRYFSRDSIGWRIATVYFFGAVGMALGGWLGGWIFDQAGSYRTAFAVGLGFNALNLLIVGVLLHRESRPLQLALA